MTKAGRRAGPPPERRDEGALLVDGEPVGDMHDARQGFGTPAARVHERELELVVG
jgi:hypothetical protein